MTQPTNSPNYRQVPYYDKDVDFDELAEKDPDWAAVCKSAKQTKWIGFQDPKVVLYVTHDTRSTTRSSQLKKPLQTTH